MPLSVGTRRPPSPPPPPPPPPPSRVDERLELTWHAPDGRVWPLTLPRGRVRVLATSALRKAPDVETTLDARPRGGADVRHQHEQERYLLLPLLLDAREQGYMSLVELARSLNDAFMQTLDLGAGVLRVRYPDGRAREISARYHSGWDGVDEYGPGVNWDIIPALTLVAESPHWRDTQPIVLRYAYADPIDYFDPYRSISSGQVLGDVTVHNPGSVMAWPTWRITGPLAELTATNHTTGESFVLNPDWDNNGPLGAGDTVTITTDPTQVRGPDGSSWLGAINLPGGVLWGLRRGDNKITFTALGAAEGTVVEIAFHPLHRTA